jgi:hypothetical protein
MLPHSLHPTLKTILLAVVALIVIAPAFEVYKIGPRNVIGMLRYDRRREGDLKVGDRAPDAFLVSLDGRSRQPLLQATNGKPTVLVFGSFT